MVRSMKRASSAFGSADYYYLYFQAKKKKNKNPELLPAGGTQDVQHAGSDRCSFPLCEAAVVSGVEGAEPGHNVKST